jgi:hypothetical protein
MAAETLDVHLDFNGNEIQNAVLQPLTADPASPKPMQVWSRSNLASGGGGNGVIRYADSGGNILQLATGSSALSSAYSTITDGAVSATASGADTFKLRTAGGGFTVAVVNNDGTHGDNALFTLDTSTTGGANKIPQASATNQLHAGNNLILNAQTPVATAGAISYFGGYWSGGDGTASDNFLQSTKSASGITNKTFTKPGLTTSSPPTAGVAGQLGFTTTSLQFADGTVVQTVASLAQTQTFTNKTWGDNLNMGGFRITGLGTPTSSSDAATKLYVDDLVTGLDVKGSVRVASTGNVAISSPGASIDGITLANGNRVLLKDQSIASQNGIYVFNGSGSAMTRSTDADASGEVTAGLYVWVEDGTTNADSGWILITDGTIILDTTALAFTQFSGSASVIAGNGLTKTGSTIDVVGTTNRITVATDSIDISSAYVGQTSITTLGIIGTGTWQGTVIGLAYGGTGVDASAGAGAATARDATHLGRPATAPATATNVTVSATGILATAKFTITGTGAATAFTLIHNLNNSAPIIGPLILASSGAREWAQCVVTSATAVIVTFNTAPGSGVVYNITIMG